MPKRQRHIASDEEDEEWVNESSGDEASVDELSSDETSAEEASPPQAKSKGREKAKAGKPKRSRKDGTKDLVADGKTWKRVTYDAEGRPADVKYYLQQRPAPSPSPVEGAWAKAVTLLQDGINGRVELHSWGWQKTSAGKFFDHIKRVEDSKTPFLEKVLRLVDSGDIIRFKSIDFWEECAEETGWKGIDLVNRMEAKRDYIDLCADATEQHDSMSPSVYLVAGFNAGSMTLLYTGRTTSHARRMCNHYGRMLSATPASQEMTMLYSLFKGCDRVNKHTQSRRQLAHQDHRERGIHIKGHQPLC
jgi:hypothetical protein